MDLFGMSGALEAWIHPQRCDVVAPIVPMCSAIFGMRCHSSSLERFVCSIEVTLVEMLLVRQKTVHKFCSGSGKRVLKAAAKDESDV